MRDEAPRARDELVRFIEKELGWDVTRTRVDQDDRYDDEPIELEIDITCRKKIKRSDRYRVK